MASDSVSGRMSEAVDLIEDMFEYEGMSPSSTALAVAPSIPDALQARIRSLERTTLQSRALPTLSALEPLLPGGALKAGAVYSVAGSLSLSMAMMAAPSQSGSWCAVIGIPEFGAEAAARIGVDLDRLVLVPDPGDQWLAVTAAMVDIVGVVLTRPPRRTAASGTARLEARLRQRGALMIVDGAWPGGEAALGVVRSEWQGLGSGHGLLSARRLTVSATWRGMGARTTSIWLPDGREQIRSAEYAEPVPIRGASVDSRAQA